MGTARKHILCVEDNSDTCEIITVLLKDAKVISARSKAEALRWASTAEFDLYLLDYHLLDGTGFEVCDFIRSFDHRTPILFCTAAESITEADAWVMKAQGLIRKGPDFLDKLIAAVSRLLPVSTNPQPYSPPPSPTPNVSNHSIRKVDSH